VSIPSTALQTDAPPTAAPQATGSPAETVVTRRPGPAEVDPVRFLKRRRRTDNLLRFGVPVLLIIAWQLFSMAEVLDPRFFPAPTEIARALVDALKSGVLQDAVWVSVRRMLIGYALGSAVGILVGFALGVVRPLRIAFEPILSALYTVPKLAILPLLLLIFGLGDTPKILLIAMSVFFIVSISTTAAVWGLSESYREPARSFGATPLKAFGHVLLPAVLPEIFVALRIAAGTAVLVLVGIEFVQGGEGIGWLIWNSWQLFLADRMYVGIVTVAVIGVIFQTLVKWIGRLLTPWASTKDSKEL
jgi:NitT/TauT family transport system permease protein/sulfonate transport system permease protein